MSDDDTRGLFFRTVLTSEVKRGWFRAKVELLDARGYATDVKRRIRPTVSNHSAPRDHGGLFLWRQYTVSTMY